MIDVAPHSRPAPHRLWSIDFARIIAICFVVTIHIGGSVSVNLLSEVARFAVPLFFAISGYFFTAHQSYPLRKRVFRLVWLYVFWVAVYALADWLLTGGASKSSVTDFIFGGGPGFHLWFVSSLIQVMLLFVVLKKRGWRAVLTTSLAVYILNALLGPYSELLGLSLEWNPRNGPAFGLIFFCFGAWVQETGWRPSSKWFWLVVFVASVGFNAAEFLVMQSLDMTFPYGRPDVRLMTLPLGISAMCLVLLFQSSTPRQKLLNTGVHVLSSFTLGVYVLHVLIIQLLQEIDLLQYPREVTLCAVIVLSFGAVWALSKIKLARLVI